MGVGFSFRSSFTILSVEIASSLCRWEEKSCTLWVLFRQSWRVMKCFLVTSSPNRFWASLVQTSALISAYSRFRKDTFMLGKLLPLDLHYSTTHAWSNDGCASLCHPDNMCTELNAFVILQWIKNALYIFNVSVVVTRLFMLEAKYRKSENFRV